MLAGINIRSYIWSYEFNDNNLDNIKRILAWDINRIFFKMIEEFNYKKEIEPLIKKQTEEDISLEFLNEFRKLCRKYNRDFVQGEIHIVAVNFPPELK